MQEELDELVKQLEGKEGINFQSKRFSNLTQGSKFSVSTMGDGPGTNMLGSSDEEQKLNSNEFKMMKIEIQRL